MISRRNVLKGLGAGGLLGLTGCKLGDTRPQGPRVVIVGGGFGGATCARYLRFYAPGVHVTVVEPSKKVITCPMSNGVIGGLRDIESLTHGYDGLIKLGVRVVHDKVVEIDPAARTVHLEEGDSLEYDRLVLSPGIDFRWDAIEGYDSKAVERMPHAWKAGEQTLLLRRQIQAMRNSGVVIITVPGMPYRCPPGPYERASLIANWLKVNKPRSKLFILDAKDDFVKRAQFMAGWEQLYPGMIEWVSGSNGGKIETVNPVTLHVSYGNGLYGMKGDVVNVIPPQRAGAIAVDTGLTDETGWCPVEPRTFESTKVPLIHVVGDACIAGAMPKSAHSANNQAKICAAAIAALFAGQPPLDPVFTNTCYSLLEEHHGISVVGIYRVGSNGIEAVKEAGGVTPVDADRRFHAKEAAFAQGWYRSIVTDSFG